MNVITGRSVIEIAGESRTIAADMNAAAILFDKYGEHFPLWLLERFAGTPVELADGSKGRRMKPVNPNELCSTLYALLASDRHSAARIETEEDLAQKIPFLRLDKLQVEVARTVMVSFGIPGEAFEAAIGAEAEPRKSRRAARGGTGTQF